MNIYQRQIFGTKKGATSFNTEIGGVSATISSASALATKLGISSSRVADFTIVGSDIKCNITGGSYSIPTNAFKNLITLTWYKDINGLVTSIAVGAFYGCTGVTGSTNYVFPAVTTISSSTSGGTSGTFQNNTGVTAFSFPSLTGFTTSGASCFSGNTAMTVFSAPNLNGEVYANQFNNCGNLTTLIIGTITAVRDNAFNNCGNLTAIDLSLVTIIETLAFNNCAKLSYVNNMNSCITIQGTAFAGCVLLPSFSANSVTSIGTKAFYNCYSITSYSFPALTTFSSSTSGGVNGTFQNNTALISFSAPNLTSITSGGGAFNGNINMTTFYAPSLSGSLSLQIYMFLNCSKLNSFTVGNVTAIGDFFFQGCAMLDTIYIPTLTSCGSSTANNSVFLNIKTGATITVAASLATVNAGAPDGDLVYASGTRGATIVYV